MQSFIILDNIFNNNLFLIVLGVFIGLVSIICIPPLSKLLLYIHELGHIIHLILAFKTFKIHWNIIVNPKRKFNICIGHTECELYTLLVTNKSYVAIRVNAVSGSFFTIIIFTLCILLWQTHLPLLTGVSLAIIIAELLVFFGGSDFKHFRHPEKFEYKY